MLHFVLGRIKSGKTSYIINKIKENSGERAFLLVPEQHSHSFERLMCNVCGNSVASYAEVTSFRRLSSRAGSELGGLASAVVSGGRRILLLRRAVSAVSASLQALKKSSLRPERLPDLLSAIDEFKAYGISPKMLSGILPDISPACAKKMRDLALIYAAYENELSDEEFDSYDEMSQTARLLQSGEFWKNRTLCLDGFSGFTSAELEIISSAIAHANDVYIALELPKEFEHGAENGIFDKVFDTKKRLSELAERNGVKTADIYLEKNEQNALSHLDKAVFSDEIIPFEDSKDEITIARADGVFEECEMAAAYILDNIRNGARYRDFSVAVSDPLTYLPIAESVFSRYGIPVYTSRETSILNKPPVALILSALDCILRGFKPESVMEYLKTGFSGIRSKSLDLFENYIYTWSPRTSEWSDENGFTRNPRGISAEETDETCEELRIINCVRKKIYEPIDRLRRAISGGKTGEQCAEALFAFINEINLPRRISAYAYLCELRGSFTEAQEYEAIMGIMYDAIDNIGLSLCDDVISIDELHLIFRLVIADGKLSSIPATLDCVNVSDLSRADGERCPYRIILGTEDGAFPKSVSTAGIISDNDRTELSDYGIELAPCFDERIFEEYRTVHSVLCTATKGLYISSSSIGENGEEKQESSTTSRLREIFPNAKNALSVFEARLRAKAPCFDESIANGKLLSLWENDDKYKSRLNSAMNSTQASHGPLLDPENIHALFGKRIRLSASRADLFESCRYAYFLKYGMRAKERERAEISPIEAGTLMHFVLEKVFSAISKEKDYNEDKALRLAEDAISEYTENAFRGAGAITGRSEFLINRLSKTVKNAVSDICREMKKSEFAPREFELQFTGDENALPPIEISGENSTVLLRGAVDRVDTFERDGRLFFRVIDYKSGKKEFELDETLNGIGMQMLLYMSALEEMSEKHFGKPASGAGVMYVPIAQELPNGRGAGGSVKRREGVVLLDRGIIDAMEAGEDKVYIPVSLDKKGGIKKSSVVLSRRQFDAVGNHLKKILASIGDELSRGEIEPNPYAHKAKTSCDYCEFKSVCALDDSPCGGKKRELIEVTLKDISEGMGGEEDE